MKRFIAIFFISILTLGYMAQRSFASDDKLFPYPVVPEEKAELSQRCNYLVDHFWDRCNLKQAFSSQSKLSEAFGDWISFMPYATADTVHMAIDKFLKSLEKQNKNLPVIGRIAEHWLYCDSAEYQSEELYYPFAQAIASNKKVASADRARYEAHARLLANSKLGDTAPDFTFRDRNGAIQNFSTIVAPNVILFFNDPDCSDCTLARMRLSADYNIQQLIKKGLMTIVSIYPGDGNDSDWIASLGKYPEDWTVGASDEVDTIFTMNNMPSIYFLDANHKIIVKDVVVDNLLNAARLLNTQHPDK